jgi:hypothetical protein
VSGHRVKGGAAIAQRLSDWLDHDEDQGDEASS